MNHAPARRDVRARVTRLLVMVVLSAAVGCASSPQWVALRDTPRNPLAGPLQLVARSGPKPTPRTEQLLRRYDLRDDLRGSRTEVLTQLSDLHSREPNREHEYALAELAYIAAKHAEPTDRSRALQFYSTSLIHAYRYLFDDTSGEDVNVYDPQFRGASDLYNQSLEGMLRIVRRDGDLRPGVQHTIKTSQHDCSLDVVIKTPGWHAEDFDRFEFVSDYKVQGLKNHYHTFGLGVPLIAIREKHEGETVAEQFYPSNLAFPVTAFLKVSPQTAPTVDAHVGEEEDSTAAPQPMHFVVELYDPLQRQTIDVAEHRVPLESDLSTPLAYFLSQPELSEADISTVGLLFPGKVEQLQGLYMLEPYDPNKMPVVMVHGLWSSPLTWMEMFNDLHSDPLVRQHYQFWFYLYPTGQPFWTSAAEMRADLANMRDKLDPEQQHPALDRTVLIGHSMGGLVSRLQTVESEDDFWETLSDRPFEELDADPEVRERLASTFFFHPNPAISRVVTIGTPHRGSQFSNGVTRWLGSRLITLPQRMMLGRQQILARNRDYFRPDAPLDIRTSIDSLAPDSPLLPVLLTADPAPWVAYHNIVGHDTHGRLGPLFTGEGDGVVPLASARLDAVPQVRSQIEIAADHGSVHRHPQAVLEVRRVLFEQLAELQMPGADVMIASHQEDDRRQPSEPHVSTGQAHRHPPGRVVNPSSIYVH
jgi:pimeloyl-ACP methyl ester carboxylesterase